MPGKPSLTDPTECSRGTRWLGYGELQACLYEDSGRAVLLKDPVEFMNEPGGFYVHTRFDVEVRDHDASNPLPSSFNCP